MTERPGPLQVSRPTAPGARSATRTLVLLANVHLLMGDDLRSDRRAV